MASAPPLTVLVVDPDDDRRAATVSDLDHVDPDLGCHEAGDEATALAIADERDIDAVVTAADIDGVSGLALAASIRDRQPDVSIVLHSDDIGGLDTESYGDLIVEYLPRSIPDRGAALLTLIRDLVSEHRQVAYPVPENERQRLASLRRYDVPGMKIQATADRLADLARDHLDAAVGFVGLVDAHFEEFIGCAGADWGTEDREKTICTHTVFENQALVVPDVHEDPRFSAIEWFDDEGIRSYAGVPIRSETGDAIGSFCVVDSAVREFTDREVEILAAYTTELEEQLELRHAVLSGDSSGVLGANHE